MTPPAAELVDLAAAIAGRWAGGEPPDAAVALAAHPELAAEKLLVKELAYEEYCTRVEAGEPPPEPRGFAARFPFPSSVFRLLTVHSFLGHLPSFGGGGRPAVQFQPGEVVGELRVRRRLGRGGFSDVYLVDDLATGPRPLVLKVSTRGEHEARTLGKLSHPHLMPVWGAPRVGDGRAVLSPYLGQATGDTLLERAAGGETPTADWLLRAASTFPAGDPPVPHPPPFLIRPDMSYHRAVRLVSAAAADALQYLHAQGVAHRDLKPSNLLLGPTGFPYLLDFNLADDGRAGRAGGTAAYAAPEVLAALRADSAAGVNWAAADVYSFAVMVCELLLLRHPYLTASTASTADLTQAAVGVQGTMTAAHLPLPAAARKLLLRALSPHPLARPTAAALAHGLAPRRRRWWGWAVAAGLALAVGGGTWALLPPPVAEVERESADSFARGCRFYHQGDSEKAIAEFKAADAADPSGPAADCLAFLHAQGGSVTVTLEQCDRAVRQGRDTVPVHTARAAAELQRGELDAAAAAAERALELDRGCVPAKFNLALVAVGRAKQLKARLDRRVIAHLEAGLAGGGGLSAGAWGTVAEAYLLVDHPTPADRDTALKAVASAIAAGHKRGGLERNLTLADALADHPGWQAALATPRDPNRPAENAQLVCPIP